MTLDLNSFNYEDAPQQTEFALLPDNAVVRGLAQLSGVDMEIPELGGGQDFQSSASGAKWMPIENTIVGGEFDKRKIWENIVVDGAKLDDNC